MRVVARSVKVMLTVCLVVGILAIQPGCGAIGPAGGGLFGSASLLSSSSRPSECTDSVLWDMTGNPSLVGATLVVATYELAKHKPEYKPLILDAVDFASDLVEQDKLTYFQFAAKVTQRSEWVNRYFGERLVVITSILGAFDREIPINQCDRDLIRRHLAKQRAMLLVLGGD